MEGIEGYAVITDELNGKCFYTLEANAVAQSRIFYYEFEVEYSDGRTETFPNDGYLKLRIMNDLGGVS